MPYVNLIMRVHHGFCYLDADDDDVGFQSTIVACDIPFPTHQYKTI